MILKKRNNSNKSVAVMIRVRCAMPDIQENDLTIKITAQDCNIDITKLEKIKDKIQKYMDKMLYSNN